VHSNFLVHVDELVSQMGFMVEQEGAQRGWPLPSFQAWFSKS
jgi:hypothetical protein